VSKLPLQVMKI